VRKKGFTLIELLVVISIIALLLSILMPGLTAAKKRVRAVVCRSNLKQWGYVYSLYGHDNDDSFPLGDSDGIVSAENSWMLGALLPYYDTLDMRMCPSTITLPRPPSPNNIGSTFTNWGPFPADTTGTGKKWYDSLATGSYAFNEWCADVPANAVENWWNLGMEKAIRKLTVSGAYNIPLVGDSAFVDTAVRAGDKAPPTEDDFSECYWHPQALGYYCMARHKNGINMVFVDMGARAVGVRELWTLRWHKGYNTGIAPANAWPPWLQEFPEF
jgi:prepilin-type N-terminal cleavage/methylation domain-containing protein